MTLPAGFSNTKDSSSYDSATSNEGEVVLWYREHKKGIFNRKVTSVEKITTKGISVNDNDIHVPYFDLENIIIMNQHRSYSSVRSGVWNGSYNMGMTSGANYGVSQGTSKTVGDLVFYRKGGELLTFKDIHDPQGLKQLATTAWRRGGGGA